MPPRILLALAVVLALPTASLAEEPGAPVRLFAAGSLKAALSEATAAFTRMHGVAVEAVYGPSGLLRQRLEGESGGAVFASADLNNPRKLESLGKAGPVVVLARNQLCALVRPGLAVTPDTLLDTMLDPAVKLGTSTPKADPSGDYAWEVFAKAEALRSGAQARLESKALTLVGGPNSATPPAGVGAYAWHLRDGRADLFLTYCTNARAALADLPGATVVALPPPLATGAEYGLTVLRGAEGSGRAAELALFLLSAEGQTALAKQGFEAPLQPRRTR